MTIINRDTFTATSDPVTETFKSGYSFTCTLGTVEVTLRGQTRKVEAKLFNGDEIVAYGMVGRYQTGSKVWDAWVSSKLRNGKVDEDARFGRYDNHPKFRKENCLWFKD